MYAHKKTCTRHASFKGRTSLSFLAQVRLYSFFSKLTVRITLGHTYLKHVRRTTCLYEIVSKIALRCCSFQKADAKVVLLHIPTKHLQHFFLEFFVNKYN